MSDASFAGRLRERMQSANCTASELADASGVAKSTISRYLSEQRAPSPASENPAKLAAGLASIARERGVPGFDENAIRAELEGLAGNAQGFVLFPERLGLVLDTFGVTRNRLARSMDFDPSYISRILAGQRRPADLPAFVDGIASYIARNYNDAAGVALTANLTGQSADKLASQLALADAIRRYLDADGDARPSQPSAMDAFLGRLDEFNLNDFMKQIRFDELKVPTVPFQLPTAKTYSGIEEMKQAELDFLKAAVTSKATDDVILYSDMPLGEMAEDGEFAKRIMYGMAMLIRKGLHLHNIHDVHRPLNELFMGLEGWIPLYMTGQISPYYLPQPTNTAFLHFIRSAGSVAVSGEAIAGNQGGGRYVVTKSATDVAYLRRRAEELLAHAKPLMRIFREEDSDKLRTALRRLEQQAKREPQSVGTGTFDNMTITVWPESHALIEKARSPQVSFLVEYPALVDALTRYAPTLF